ncbi:MAG: hypothetical protein WDZ64_00900 [Parcubacteria group bacterium]
MRIEKIIFLKLRFVMALIFLWAFFDKTFGWGFNTLKENAWINGGSPTSGFLSNATRGPLAEFFSSLSGVVLVDWVFMIGLLGVGLTLFFNRLVVWGSLFGALMMLLMYLAAFPPTTNPLLDSHVVYILVFALLASKNRDR